MATLAEIRAKLLEAETRGQNNQQNRNYDDSASYPFWDLPDGGTSVVRFLPDGNPGNTFFWVERAMIRLPFQGIKGQTDNREIQVSVPCMEMYGATEVCPVLSEVRGWYKLKDPTMDALASKYWKKRTYVCQGFVVNDGVGETNKPENPIRRFSIGPQLYKLINSAIMDPELEETPTDYDRGIDFKIVKNKNGIYADYSTSSFARRERALTDIELDSVDQHGLFNLSDYLPEKPDAIRLEVIKEMFQASVDGEQYDPERWGQYYRPRGLNAIVAPHQPEEQRQVAVTYATRAETPSQFSTSPEVVSAPAAVVAPAVPVEPVVEAVVVPAPVQVAPQVAPASANGATNAQDILAMIRNRNQAQA